MPWKSYAKNEIAFKYGVAVPAGHAARAWVDRRSGAARKTLIKLDFENAFNTISRQQVLDNVASDFPDLARWVAWCYGFFFHDDGVLAGDIRAAAAALPHVQSRAAQLGLRLNLAKCEVVAVGRTSAGELAAHLPDALLRHPDGSSKVRRNFDLLVAPVGNDAFIAAHAAERVKRAGPLLEAVGKLDDPQVGLRLLRGCAGHSRLVHSMPARPLCLSGPP